MPLISFLFHLRNLLILLLLLLVLQSCYTITGNQTAQTLPPREVEGGVNVSVITYPDDIWLNPFDPEGEAFNWFLSFDGYGRLGVAKYIDVGVKFDYLGNLQPDIKLCFLQTPDSFVALASGFMITTNTSYWFVDPELSLTITSLGVPVYASIHPSRQFDIYASGRYFVFPFFEETGHSSYIVYNSGIRVGGDVKFTIDVSHLKPFGTLTSNDLLPVMTYFSVGLLYRLH